MITKANSEGSGSGWIEFFYKFQYDLIFDPT